MLVYSWKKPKIAHKTPNLGMHPTVHHVVYWAIKSKTELMDKIEGRARLGLGVYFRNLHQSKTRFRHKSDTAYYVCRLTKFVLTGDPPKLNPFSRFDLCCKNGFCTPGQAKLNLRPKIVGPWLSELEGVSSQAQQPCLLQTKMRAFVHRWHSLWRLAQHGQARDPTHTCKRRPQSKTSTAFSSVPEYHQTMLPHACCAHTAPCTACPSRNTKCAKQAAQPLATWGGMLTFCLNS